MRIIYPHPMEFPNKKAHSIQIINTCFALAQKGVDVILIVSKLGKKTVKECLDFYGLPEHPNLKIKGSTQKIGRKKFNLFVIWEVLKYRKDKNVVLFFRDIKSAKLFITLKWFLKVPCILEADAPASGYRSLLDKLNREEKQLGSIERLQYMVRIWRHKNLEKSIYANINGIICQTKGIKNAICEDFAVCAFIDVFPCAAKLMDRQFEENAVNILYLGHLYPQKGVDILIEALKYIPDRKLLIVGGNTREDMSRIKNLSLHLGVDKQVIFVGCVSHSDIGKYFNGAGVSVIPIMNTIGQRLFTSPMKLFEYMSAKIPIVASDFPSMREILENGKTAVLVEPENPQALAEGIEKVLADRDFAKRIAEEAYKKMQDFTWEKRAERIVNFIENTVKNDYRD